MLQILQQEKPEEYVIAMAETIYKLDFVWMAFAELGIQLEFKGYGVNEEGFLVVCMNTDY
jgi:GDPmannose 4,6-dehydratase